MSGVKEIPSENFRQWIIQVENLKRPSKEARIGLRFYNPDGGREDSPLRAITKSQARQLVAGLVDILIRMEVEDDAALHRD